jgi:hypothetical protein
LAKGIAMKIKNIWRQFIDLLPILLVVYVPFTLLLVVLLVLYLTIGVPMSIYFDDTSAVFKYGSLNGLISNIGIFLLASAASVFVFSYFFMKDRDYDRNVLSFLMSFGIITAILMIDDWFLIHEMVGDLLAGIFLVSEDVGELLTFIIYAGIFVYFTIRYRKIICQTEYFLFTSAIVLLGISLAIDLNSFIFPLEEGTIWFKIFAVGEEVVKFFAIINWFTYAIRTSYKLLKNPDIKALQQ